jgi:predicted amidohydrolase YtcJ
MKNSAMISVAAFALVVASCTDNAQPTSQASADRPDMCLHNGSIYSNGSGAITVKDGKIAQLMPTDGDIDSDCSDFANTSTEIIDLKGSFVFPGFVDSHGHLLGIGLRELELNLEGTPSIKAMVETLEGVVANTPDGVTIYGRGWIETHWPENRFPTRQDLDRVSPNNPVILGRSDGHASVVNSKALEMAGIDRETIPPFGGDILRGADGKPTGMLIDTAEGLVDGLIKDLTPEKKRAAYIKASEVYAAYGWTGIHSMSVDPADIDLIEQLSNEGLLNIRVYNAIDINGAAGILNDIAENGPRKSANITSRTLKLYGDGALGSRGAALLAPYSDDPENTGLFQSKKQDTLPILERALRDGIQVCYHAIGDGANRLILDWFEEAMNNVPVSERKIADPRWRIEHSQIIDPADIPRFKELGVIPSMQPSHAIGDLHFAIDRLGVDRLAGGYAWRSLIDSGVIIAGGSDAPVERGDPRIEFYGAVARKDMKGFSGDGWHPEEKVTRVEALKMFTVWAAYAAFEEDSTGTIEVGKNADFTIFDKDIMAIPEADILSVTPVMTIVDGNVIYKR